MNDLRYKILVQWKTSHMAKKCFVAVCPKLLSGVSIVFTRYTQHFVAIKHICIEQIDALATL